MSMMFEEKKALETISLDYLYAGLVAHDDIYNHDGTLLLVAKGITLTENTLQKLKRFNSGNQNIKVTSNVRKQLMNKGLPPKVMQENFENDTGYSEIKGEATNILAIAQVTYSVPYEQVYDVGSLVLDRIDINDPASLLQCINASNEADDYLHRHSANVAMLNGLIGKWLGLSGEEIENLVLAGLVHDIGKTKVPSEILNSPNKLTEAEFKIVKKHSVYSYEMLSGGGKFNEAIRKAVLHHHERMNGSGYPDRLMSDEIPLYSRITAISDVYDAMVSKRPHKDAHSPFQVLLQMQTDQFSGLDIKLVRLFNEHMPKELIGKSVLLSDGKAGIVRHINEQNMEYPVIEVDGEIILTNKDLYCVSMIIDNRLIID
jgi:HD-GYP domain-containing protein (c-di-GMP phosphodiesterase class II)